MYTSFQLNVKDERGGATCAKDDICSIRDDLYGQCGNGTIECSRAILIARGICELMILFLHRLLWAEEVGKS